MEPIEGAAAELALKKLATTAYGAAKYVVDLKSKRENLQNTMTWVEAELRDGESMSEQCSSVDQRKLEELSFQLDRWHDLSDVRASRKLQKQVMGGGNFTKTLRSFFSPSNQLVARIKEAREVDDIQKKLNSIVLHHGMFGGCRNMPPQARSIERVGSPSNILANIVVGRDKDRDQIVSMLSEESMASGNLSVASIVGIGGMGKTTLAWYVYNDERIKCCFDVQFWVSMTQDFDVDKVLVEMITACGEGKLPHNLSNIPQLYHHFQRAIAGKKFLLVLDNICDHDTLRQKWIDLQHMLSAHAAGGSWVLITTRNKKVAEICSTTKPYKLGDLTEEDSWLLFKKIAFTQRQDPDVEAIGMEIVKMCPKVPLVIRSIGGLLSKKDKLWQWNAFKDDLVANFASSCGDEVMDTLKVSYDHLDETQKLCVNFWSLFEKGGNFSKDLMINRWVALGCFKHTNEQHLEAAAHECLISLVECEFLQSFFDGSFLMHDVMYELVLKLAGFKYKVTDSSTVKIDDTVRHLSFWEAVTSSVSNEDLEDGYWEVPSSLFKIKHLHSLIRGNSDDEFSGDAKKLKVSNLSMCVKFISNSKYVKVLDLQGVGIKELPTSVGDLICLRFLNLSQSEIVKLPNSITRLVKLQSLYLSYCDNLEELPRDMSNLVKLRHLELEGSKKLRHMPMGLGNLTDLRTLDIFIVGNQIDSEVSIMGKLSDLNQLNNLSGRLDIEVRRESKYITPSEIDAAKLEDKENLRRLRISFKNGAKEDERVLECLRPHSNLEYLDIEGYGGERLPSWMVNDVDFYLRCLIEIEIKDCKSCKYLCSLGRLPHLEYLTLSGLDEVEYVEDITDNNNESELSQTPLFPSLELLSVSKMPKLKGWWRREQDSNENLNVQVQHQQIVNWKPAFHKLQELNVDNLELAITIAKQQIGGFTSVEELQINFNYEIEQQALTLPLSSCFPNLHDLQYNEVRLEALPEGIRDLSSLQYLSIVRIGNIKAIPEWIDSLVSLESLELTDCPRLETLPHQIANLPNLKTLRIDCCPILWERCQSPDGEYYKYIQHIPHIYMYDPRETKNK